MTARTISILLLAGLAALALWFAMSGSEAPDAPRDSEGVTTQEGAPSRAGTGPLLEGGDSGPSAPPAAKRSRSMARPTSNERSINAREMLRRASLAPRVAKRRGFNGGCCTDAEWMISD